MAVPSRVKSKAKVHSRSANWKLSVPNLVECAQCHALVLAHRVCKKCGYYAGKSIISVESK